MTLEMEAIETSLQKLAPSGWTPSVAYDKNADAELMKEDRMEAEKREKRKKGSGFFACAFVLCFLHAFFYCRCLLCSAESIFRQRDHNSSTSVGRSPGCCTECVLLISCFGQAYSCESPTW